MDEIQDQQHTRTSLPALSTPQKNLQEATAVSAALSKLALHYWRPDFTPGQAKLMMVDYLADLDGFTPAQVGEACAKWRRNGENKFFPRPGELLELLKPKVGEPRLRLATFRGYPALEAPRATKSVAQILRENGMNHEARRWDGQ